MESGKLYNKSEQIEELMEIQIIETFYERGLVGYALIGISAKKLFIDLVLNHKFFLAP